MDLAALLAAGRVEDFNLARSSRSRPDLFAADLAGAQIPEADLSSANLSKADLSGADLSDANLVKADLSGIDGTGLKLVGALAVRSRLNDAWLEEADLSEADFSRARLAEAVLTRSLGTGLRLVRSNLKGVDAREAQWTDCDLSAATISRADFSKADLSRSDLTETTAKETKLEGARLDHAVARSARMSQARLAGASLVGARLEGADLSGADLSGADLSSADLTSVNLSGANLSGARLVGTVLANACLDGVDLQGADLSSADLSGLDATALHLDDDQVASLVAFGVQADPDAPLQIKHPAVGRSSEDYALLWTQTEAEDTTALRWALTGPASSHRGLLPIAPTGVLAQRVLPWEGGFLLVLVQKRPAGTTLVLYPLSSEGELGTATQHLMGWTPATQPIFTVAQGEFTIMGMAAGGGGVIAQRFNQGTLGQAGAWRIPTARSFLGRHHPVLSSKGGVVIPVTPEGPQPPLATPSGFLGRGAAALVEERVLLAWVEASRGEDEPGGVRCAWLERRSDPQILALGHTDQVEHLEVLAQGQSAWVVWTERHGSDLRALRASLPRAQAESLTMPGLAGIRLAPTIAGQIPGWALLREDGGARLESLDGEPGGALEP